MDIYNLISENINEILEKDNIRDMLSNNSLRRYFTELPEDEVNIRILTIYVTYLLTFNSNKYKYIESAGAA